MDAVLALYRDPANQTLSGAADVANTSKVLLFANRMDFEIVQPEIVKQRMLFQAMITTSVIEWVNK